MGRIRKERGIEMKKQDRNITIAVIVAMVMIFFSAIFFIDDKELKKDVVEKVTDTVTLDKAIDEVIKKYPSFKGEIQTITTGMKTNNNGSNLSGVEAAFLARNPDLKL